MFISRKLMMIVVMVGSIHVTIADEASDAVQVLLKFWGANLEATDQQVCGGLKILKTEFVGDGKMYKMRRVVRLEDGKVEDAMDRAPFRFLEEEESWSTIDGPCRYPRSPLGGPSLVVGVECLFGRDCINTTTLTYDPVYNPNAPPKMSRSGGLPGPPDGPLPFLHQFISRGSVDPANVDRVRRALHRSSTGLISRNRLQSRSIP
jgi:hypothetical protein